MTNIFRNLQHRKHAISLLLIKKIFERVDDLSIREVSNEVDISIDIFHLILIYEFGKKTKKLIPTLFTENQIL